jgi:hypothetical protein
MKRVRRLVTGMVVASVVVTSAAWAEDVEKPTDDTVRKPRRERRERPARPEALARFKAADTDGNGTLSLAEFTVVHEKRVAEMKERLGDKWNEERAAQRPSAEDIFTRLDKDKSGELTPAEMARGMRARFERRQRPGRGKDQKNAVPGGEESVTPVVPDAPVGI